MTWAAQADGLADLSEVHVPSFYGFETLSGMARAVLEEAPPVFAVAGHSMGARVALEIMRLAPARVTRLALLDTGVHPVRPGEPAARQELVDLAREHGMPALAARWLPPMVHAADPALMAALTAMVCRATPDIFEGQVRALLSRPDAAAGLAAIRCPTLVGVGRQDSWSPVAQHQAMVAAIGGATLAIFDGAGHMAPMEAAPAVTEAMRAWLRR